MCSVIRPLLKGVRGLLLLVAVILFPVADLQPARAADLGSAYITPEYMLAQTWGSITLVYTVGEAGLAEGGSLRVQFPKSYHKSALYPQVQNPSGRYYVSATASNPDATLSLVVTQEDIVPQDVDFQDFTTTITVEGASLQPGDTVSFVFGDTSAGGMGILAGQAVARERVWVAVDVQGTGEHQMLPDLPILETRGGQATYLRAIAPSVVRAGETLLVRVVALDALDNNSSLYRGTVTVSCDDAAAEYPGQHTFTEAEAGVWVFSATLNGPGVHRFQVSDGVRSAWSNPIEVVAGEPGTRLYWGDTHVHTDASPEGYGDAQSEIRYGRDVSGLDFMGFLDHAGNATAPLTAAEWAEQTAIVEGAYAPGEFVAMCSYEWSVDQTLQGHRTVIYREGQQPFHGAITYRTVEALWSALAANGTPALTLPHHMGMQSVASNTATSWEYVNSTFQRSLEIYQVKGLWEYYDPSHPLSAENVHTYRSMPGPYYAQDAWAAGQRLGVIASSDEHWGRPGRTGYGLAAVYASSLTREGIFDAIASRHSYGTTGERIILHFTADGHRMGEEYSVSLPHSPEISVSAYGTDIIDWVEVLKYDGTGYSVIHRETPGVRDVGFSFVDEGFTGDSMYYVRLRQANQVAGRDVMAWSSPIWVDVADGPTPTPTATATEEPTPTETPAAEPTPTETHTSEPTPTDAPTPEPTPTETATHEPTPTDTPTTEPTPTHTPTTEPTPTDRPTAESTPTETPTAEPTPTATPTTAPTATATASPTSEPTVAPELGLYEHLNQGDDGSIRADGAMVVGQSFTPTQSHTVSLVRLKLYRQGSPGPATVEVRAAGASGLPTGSPLSTGTLDSSAITTSTLGEWYSVSLTPAELQASTQYIITIAVPGGDGSNRLFARWDRSDPPYGGGTALYSWDGGQGWRTVSGSDVMFEEWGSAVPVPTATPTVEPTATLTPEPTATEEPTPTGTATGEPTATDAPTPDPTPTDTPTPEPTATETPTTEPTPTETPTMEPTVAPELGLYEHLNEGDDGSIRADGAMVVGQSFTPAQAHTVSLVRLKLYRQGNPGPATVAIRAADGNGMPVGDYLSSGALDTAGLTTNAVGEWYTVEVTPAELQAGTQYVVTIAVSGGDSSNRLFCRWDRTSPPYAQGTALYSWDGGQGWRAVSTSDIMFEEWGTADATPTSTLEPTPTDTPTAEPTHTQTPTVEPTPTETPTVEPTPTPTPQPTPTQAPTVEPTATATATLEPTYTPTPEPTATDTATPEPTPTETPTPEPTATDTPTAEPTSTGTPMGESTATETPTGVPTDTPTPEFAPTETPTVEAIPTETSTPEATATTG